MLLLVTLIDVHVNDLHRCVVFMCAADLIRFAFTRSISELTECEQIKDIIDILIKIKHAAKLVFDLANLFMTFLMQHISVVSRTCFPKYISHVTFIVQRDKDHDHLRRPTYNISIKVLILSKTARTNFCLISWL